MSARSRPPTDEQQTALYDSSDRRRAKSTTEKGHHQVEQATPTDIDREGAREAPVATRARPEIEGAREAPVATRARIDPPGAPAPKAAPERSEPLRMISMKSPAELAEDKRAAQPHQVRLRSISEVRKRHATPPAGLGYLAPPRDPRAVRARRVRDYLIWGSVVVLVGSAVMIGVWFVAGS